MPTTPTTARSQCRCNHMFRSFNCQAAFSQRMTVMSFIVNEHSRRTYDGQISSGQPSLAAWGNGRRNRRPGKEGRSIPGRTNGWLQRAGGQMKLWVAVSIQILFLLPLQIIIRSVLLQEEAQNLIVGSTSHAGLEPTTPSPHELRCATAFTANWKEPEVAVGLAHLAV